ncbi:prenyltransferase/squalene oxidase repeat-containing protein [Chitinophaga rhizosphaerae]|uniref:hypothetical protein n=1 Tax=Chitinophaga rhizosphaerae TaxID=1864947 RepID=UPI000F8051AC|nr:hypothetical protein [Chitinophaga rhizosphaerae]
MNHPEAYSLLQSTGAFFDTLPSCLVSPARLPLLKAAADAFPPIIRFALECRLHDCDQVDLQLCIKKDQDDLPAICNWFRYRLAGRPELPALLCFLETWADPSSSCHLNIAEVFLELDVLPGGIRTPLLFFELQQDMDSYRTKALCDSVIKGTLGSQQPFIPLLNKIVDACPGQAHVGYLGIQFSRDVEALRVNIKKLRLQEVIPFLQKIGYRWCDPQLEQLVTFLFGNADRVTVCMDVGADLFPRLGFECFWNEPPDKTMCWQYFVDNLPAPGLAIAEKTAAVLNWDQEIFPGQVQDWPEQLWIASLQQPETSFTYIRQWISHLKVSYQPGKDLELKAYLGYESSWKIIHPCPPPEIVSLKTGKVDLPDVRNAIDKGISYLLSSQQQSGWWKDFLLEPGAADEWVTAYVGCHLARLERQETLAPLRHAWKILQTRYREGAGWGFNAAAPADADSTVWAWHFAQAAGFSAQFPAPGLSLMDDYTNENGGVVTYSLNGPIGRNSREQGASPFNGWQIPHCCVTAAYALSGNPAATGFLLSQQNNAGYWYGYWWKGPEYATALATEALFLQNAETNEAAIGKAVHWAMENSATALAAGNPNCFKIALYLKILLCARHNPHQIRAAELVNHLLETQRSQGSWPPSAELRSPDTNDVTHETNEKVRVVKDDSGIFSTATILDALHKFVVATTTSRTP